MQPLIFRCLRLEVKLPLFLTFSDIGEKLAHKLRELEEEKMLLERERTELESGEAQPTHRRRQRDLPAETLRMNEENLRKQEELVRKEDVAKRQREFEKLKQEEEKSRLQEQMRIQENTDRRNSEVLRHQDANEV